MANPTFSTISSHNAVIERAESQKVGLLENGGAHDLKCNAEAIDEQTKVVWVCPRIIRPERMNPAATLIRFLEKVPEHVLAVVDEAYYEYVTAEDYPETIPLLERFPNLNDYSGRSQKPTVWRL